VGKGERHLLHRDMMSSSSGGMYGVWGFA
jgi:hypothetical protein